MALPVDHSALGMLGCTLLTSVDFMPLQRVGNRASSFLAIPADPVLAGQSVYMQGLALDRASNALGAVLSNAVEATIGGR